MMMSPYGLDGSTPPGVKGFAQLYSPAVSSTGTFDATKGLDSLSMLGSPLAMQSVAGAVLPSPLPFGTPMHMTPWPMYPWAHTMHSQSPYPSFMSPGSTVSSAFRMSPISSHYSPGGAPPKTAMFGRSMSTPLRSEGRRNTAMRINRTQFSPPSPHHNHVDINRIKAGTDVRTTVCPHYFEPLPHSLTTADHAP